MTDNVIDFTGTTTADLDPKKVLEGAIDSCDNGAFAITLDKDENMHVFSSMGSVSEILLLLEVSKKRLLEMVE